MKIWLKRILLSLLLLLVVVTAATSLLVGTRSGVQWLLDIGNGFIPGELHVEQTQGTLLGDLKLRKLHYQTPDMDIQVEEVIFNWTPSELFSGVFHLRELTLNRLRYEKLKASEEGAAEPSGEALMLPDIQLPLVLKLDLIQLKDAQIISQPEADPLLIDEAVMIAGWTKAGIDLTKLSLTMPMFDFHGEGLVDPKEHYPMDLNLDWKLKASDLPELSGKGNVKGTLETLNIRHTIDGDAVATIAATARDLLGKADWETQIAISKLPVAYLPIEEDTPVGLTVDAKGDIAEANSRIRFTLPIADNAETESTQPLVLNLIAAVRFSDQQFTLQGDWSKLQWPLSGISQLQMPSGNMSVSGIPDNYVFKLQSLVAGKDIPDGDWRIAGKGGLKQLHLDELKGLLLDGSVVAVGELSWSPMLSWDMNLQTADINPGVLNPEWQGKLNLDISSQGKLADSGLELQADIRRLTGILRGQPIAGGGSIRMRGQDLLLNDIRLSSGSANVSADGELGKDWKLVWNLDIKDLADLLPEGKGSVQGQGSLKGSQDKPIVVGKLKASGVVAQQLQCEQCDLDFNLGLDEAYVSHLTLAGKNIQAAGQQVQELAVKLDGSMQQHTLLMTAAHTQARVEFSAAGAYLQDQLAWKGDIRQLNLDVAELGEWKLQKPANLYAAAGKIVLSPLCLLNAEAQLCAQVDRNSQKGDARLELKNLSLQRLQPWLPPEITEIQGKLQLHAKADLGDVTEAKLNLRLEPGSITFLDPLSKPVSMALRDGKLDIIYDQKNLSARWGFGLGENSLQGELILPRQALDTDPMSTPLKGSVKVVVPELSLVSSFVPAIQKIDGNIDLSLTLGGKLADPEIKGHALLQASEILIPRAGLELKELEVEAKGDGTEKLQIVAGVRSGEGELNLSGHILLDASRGWPAKMLLKGQRFQLANLPEAQVIVTPDISLETSKELIKIRGRLGVPVALIELNDLPAGSRSLSSDVIVVSEDGTVAEVSNSKVDAEVTIALGEQVHFTGFGLNADIGGRITVDQNAGKYPTANGELKIEGGSFRAYGQNLKIEQGRISYAGGRIDNPGLRLKASRKIEDITVGVELLGTAKKPQFSTFSSDPDLLEKDVVSMLLTGQKTDDLANAKVYAGKQITPDLSVGVNIGGGSDGSEFVARYRLMENVNLEGTSSAKKSGGSINYTIELE